jgi:hypothetical protein
LETSETTANPLEQAGVLLWLWCGVWEYSPRSVKYGDSAGCLRVAANTVGELVEKVFSKAELDHRYLKNSYQQRQ